MSKIQHQRPTKTTNFRTIFWYGERFYSAIEVDAELRRTSQQSEQFVSQLTDARSNVQMIRTLCNTSSDYWTAIANAGMSAVQQSYNEPSFIEPESDTVLPALQLQLQLQLQHLHNNGDNGDNGHSNQAENSPRSTCSSNNHSNGYGCGGGVRGRAIGKRNQEYYIPDGVLLSHTTTISIHADDNDCGDGTKSTVQRNWIGRYDKSSNKIIRTNGANLDNDLEEYETLKHFAQEHDRVIWQMCQAHKGVQEYRECNTPNVWTNPLFKFYNTVSLNWEPLSALRNDTDAHK